VHEGEAAAVSPFAVGTAQRSRHARVASSRCAMVWVKIRVDRSVLGGGGQKPIQRCQMRFLAAMRFLAGSASFPAVGVNLVPKGHQHHSTLLRRGSTTANSTTTATTKQKLEKTT
jgi:hypothetical protein